MKVKELIEELQHFDPELMVCTHDVDYGDDEIGVLKVVPADPLRIWEPKESYLLLL